MPLGNMITTPCCEKKYEDEGVKSKVGMSSLILALGCSALQLVLSATIGTIGEHDRHHDQIKWGHTS